MLVQLLLCFLFWQASLGELVKPVYDTDDVQALNRLFEEYLQKYNKVYDGTKRELRFEIFVENLKEINELNELYAETIFDINHLTDWTEEELLTLRRSKMPARVGNDDNCKMYGDPKSKAAPAAYDWREHGAVSPVKNQKDCGSCWAFSTTGLLESRYLQKKLKLELSEQQLVDCSTKIGCNGSLPYYALTYLMKAGGIESQSSYPYQAAVGSCKFDKSKVAARVVSCSEYKLTSEDALKELLYQEGPISIGVSAHKWNQYKGGIFSNCDNAYVDHDVLLVGYGTEGGQDFWTIKNSWGPSYGEKGYIRIKRGVNCAGIGGNDSEKVSAIVA